MKRGTVISMLKRLGALPVLAALNDVTNIMEMLLHHH
jgi:hypothetical protein